MLKVVHIHTMAKELDMSAMENCVCFNLRWVTRRVTQFFDAEMRRHGIRPTQGTLLRALVAKAWPRVQSARSGRRSPAQCAIAGICSSRFVDPPNAACVTIAL